MNHHDQDGRFVSLHGLFAEAMKAELENDAGMELRAKVLFDHLPSEHWKTLVEMHPEYDDYLRREGRDFIL